MENMTTQGNPYAPQMMGQQQFVPQPFYRNNPVQAQQPQTPPYFPKICDFVQGDIGATIFAINFCNQEATLIDADDPNIIYRKSRDASGKMSPVTKYHLVPFEDKKEEVDLSGFVKSDEILDLISDTVKETVKMELDKRLSEISFKPTPKEGK